MAETYLLSREFAAANDKEAFPVAARAARHAVQLDPSLAGAWADSAYVAFWWEQDSARAFREFERALELNLGLRGDPLFGAMRKDPALQAYYPH